MNKTSNGIYLPDSTTRLAQEAVREIQERDKYKIRNKRRSLKPKVDRSDVITEDSFFERGLRLLIQRNFGFSDKWKVIREAKIYRPSKSQTIRNQLGGREPEICEVRFDNNYICDISEAMKPDEALATIQFNMIQRQIK